MARSSGQQKPLIITLPRGGKVDVNKLIRDIRVPKYKGYIIQGQQIATLNNHTKPHSLDCWLRKNGASNPDTKHAENSLIDSLVKTGMFKRGLKLTCHDTGRRCKGIVLVNPDTVS